MQAWHALDLSSLEKVLLAELRVMPLRGDGFAASLLVPLLTGGLNV